MKYFIILDISISMAYVCPSISNMTTNDKINHLKFIIGRYDTYFISINNKGSFYLAVNAFLFSSIIGAFFSIPDRSNFSLGIYILFSIAMIFSCLSIAFTLLAIKPYLNNKSDNADGSVIFFGDVAEYHVNKFVTMWSHLNETQFYSDMVHQQYLLSCGLLRKFRLLNYATWMIALQILMIVIISLIFISR